MSAPSVLIAGCGDVGSRLAKQLLAAGCAAHGILLAAYAQGIGAVWRTGEFAYDPHVMKGLGLAEQERLLGFLYLGTPERELRAVPQVQVGDFVRAWPAAQ